MRVRIKIVKTLKIKKLNTEKSQIKHSQCPLYNLKTKKNI